MTLLTRGTALWLALAAIAIGCEEEGPAGLRATDLTGTWAAHNTAGNICTATLQLLSSPGSLFSGTYNTVCPASSGFGGAYNAWGSHDHPTLTLNWQRDGGFLPPATYTGLLLHRDTMAYKVGTGVWTDTLFFIRSR